MTQTDNYGLKKPGAEDFYNIEDFNGNADIVDTTLAGLEAGKADLVDGKVPAEQLPDMNYDPAGSAAAVQTNLTAHQNNKQNPHNVTAEQAGAEAAGTASGLITGHNSAADAHESLFAGKADTGHTQAASTITAGTLGGRVQAQSASSQAIGTAQVRNIHAGTEDMTAGTSSLETGALYFVYE